LKSNVLKNEIAASVVKKWFANNNYFVLFTPKKESYFNNDKIVAPYRCKSNNFALSTVPFYGSKDIAYILPKDRSYNLKFLVCILNSTLVYKWLYFKGKRKGEMLELYSKPLSDIPIIKIHDQSKFVLLHDEIVSLKEQELNTLDLEQQIDTLVYKLYELSYEEVLLIEPDFGKRVSVVQYEVVNVD
jgi:adenine-specific DNA-methyltransferase